MFRKYLIFIAVTLLSCSMIWADGGIQKLGFINTERVYQESKQAQSIQTILDKEFAPEQQRLLKIQKQGLALKKTIESTKMSEQERKEKIHQLLLMDQQYKKEAQTLTENYDLRRNEEFASLQQNANKAIIELAQKEGYDLIIQDAIFVNGKFDITDKVIKILNNQY